MSSMNGFRFSSLALAVMGVLGAPENAFTATTDLATEPLATGLSSVPPNILYILDNSGSMERDFTPDHVDDSYCRNDFSDSRSGRTDSSTANSPDGRDDYTTLNGCDVGSPPFASADFNFQYYTPNIRYQAPFHPSDLGKAEDDNTRVYPTYNNVGSNQKWATVKVNPFVSATTRNLVNGNIDVFACTTSSPSTADKFNTATCKEPVDYTVTPGAEAAGTGSYLYPNPRFNQSTMNATFDFPFRVTRSGDATNPVAPYFYTISAVAFCKNRSTSNYTNGGGATGFTQSKHRFGKGTTDTAAAAYATNPCNTRRGNIGGTNYIYAKFGKVVHNTGNDNLNQNARLNAGNGVTTSDYEGISGFRRYEIVETVTSNNTLPASYIGNKYNGTSAKAPTRVDCAASTCTYTEEMINYANWYAYYRVRMQAMKSSTSRAFEAIGVTYRVGFLVIEPGSTVGSTEYLKHDVFNTSHKTSWYNLLFSVTGTTSTPLREALSRGGWIYGGVLNSSTSGLTNGIPTADDPIIASCQQNFALLTTDGFWNSSSGQKLDGTSIGDQDDNIATAPRPLYDGPNSGSKTAADNLADVAMYYYNTDLRSALTNDVPTTTKDTAAHQHMTTFTLGLGVDGELAFQNDYETASSGDFFNIKQGTANWPKPVSNSATTVDDLWHAAVNGRGRYFSARDPQLLSEGLTTALVEVGSRVGAGAAAATSSLRPSAGDQLAFTAQYETVKWHGDLKARTIDIDTASSTFGIVSTRDLWSAQGLLDAKTYTTRNLLTFDSTDSGGDLMKSFCHTSGGAGCLNGNGLTAGEKTFFVPSALGNTWSVSQSTLATDVKLVNYLRGDRSNEGTGTADTDLFRPREHVLGDIVNSQPVYVKKPPFDYLDDHYSTPTGFKASKANRQAVVFAGANDGMLHAFQVDPDNSAYFQTGGFATVATNDDTFSAGTNDGGGESWAYLPSMVLPALKDLAKSSPFTHQYFVDGSPVVGDICITVPCMAATDWRTIIVAGMNSGGRGYYALDITDPVNPKALWEFKSSATCLTDPEARSGSFFADCHLGFTFGTPIIAKWLPTAVGGNGKWVVFATSGYNNVSPGSGEGYLYMLDAVTGAILGRISTGVGSTATPSGLAKINAWTDNGISNNITEHIYGGDLQGNMWRFNVGNIAPASWSVTKITTAKDASAVAQPITVRPELGFPKGKRAVFFGTGRYLGTTDQTDTSVQSIYGIKDDLAGTLVDVRGAGVVPRVFAAEVTLADGTVSRTIDSSGAALDFSLISQFGFRIDLPTSGERVNVDLALQVGTIVVASNIPNTAGSCTAGGQAWENYINFETGFSVLAVNGAAGAKKFSSGLIVGTTIVQLPGGKTVAITTSADTKQTTSAITAGGGGTGSVTGRRSSWREILTE